jgi:zinc protease
LFALRGALYEFDKLIREGLSKEAFEETREFLSKYVNVLLQTQDARLGYALDSRYYKTGPYDEYLRGALAKLSVSDVNQALQRHLKADRMRIVIVTKDARDLREAIVGNKPSPITYNSPKPDDLLQEDKILEKLPITVKPEAVTIQPASEVFQ